MEYGSMITYSTYVCICACKLYSVQYYYTHYSTIMHSLHKSNPITEYGTMITYVCVCNVLYMCNCAYTVQCTVYSIIQHTIIVLSTHCMNLTPSRNI